MANTLSFTATPLPDGTIKPPVDIARRMAGALIVDVELSVRHSDSRLALLGVDAAELAAIGAAQRLEPDTAAYALSGEGSVLPDSTLFSSLLRLLPPL